MASTDNYGYGSRIRKPGYSTYQRNNDEGYNWRIEEALRRAAEARMRRAQNNAGQRSGSYYQYQSQSNDRRDFRSPTETRVGAGTLGNNGVSEQELSKWMNKGYAPKSWKTGNAWQRAAARNIALANNNKVNYRDMLINKSAKESTPVLIKNLGDKMIGVADTMQESKNKIDQRWKQAIAPYQGHNPTANTPGTWQGYSNYTPMGTPMTTQSGGVYGGYGAGLSAGDYRSMMNEYKNRYGGLVPPDPSLYRTGVPSTTAIGINVPFTRLPEWAGTMVADTEYNDYLDALRYGTRGGGMASEGYTGVDTYVPPETLPDNTGGGGNGGGYGYDQYPLWGDLNLRGGGGYGGGYGGYGGYGGNNYRINYNNSYRGGAGTRSNDINQWYANMVNWNIGRPKGG